MNVLKRIVQWSNDWDCLLLLDPFCLKIEIVGPTMNEKKNWKIKKYTNLFPFCWKFHSYYGFLWKIAKPTLDMPYSDRLKDWNNIQIGQ